MMKPSSPSTNRDRFLSIELLRVCTLFLILLYSPPVLERVTAWNGRQTPHCLSQHCQALHATCQLLTHPVPADWNLVGTLPSFSLFRPFHLYFLLPWFDAGQTPGTHKSNLLTLLIYSWGEEREEIVMKRSWVEIRTGRKGKRGSNLRV